MGTQKEEMLLSVLIKMERSFGIGDANVVRGTRNTARVNKEHLTSLELELNNLGLRNQYEIRLNQVQDYLSTWTARRQNG